MREKGTMATIALYASRINQMPGLMKETKKSVVDYRKEQQEIGVKNR